MLRLPEPREWRIGLPMALILTLAMAAAITRPAERPACAIGAAVMRELPALDRSARRPPILLLSRLDRPSILNACPSLRTALPPGVRLATPAETREAGAQGRDGGAWFIRAPRVVAGGREAAVEVSYRCAGLCGRGWVLWFGRAGSGWRRDGVAPTFVA